MFDKLKYLFSRLLSLYFELGIQGVLQGMKKYFKYGSFRDDLIRILPVTERITRYYIMIGHLLFHSRYTDADPLKIIWVDPGQIEYDVSNTDLPRRFGRVCGGNWDQTDHKFTEKSTYRSLERHLLDGVPWEETHYYQRKRDKLERGKPTRGCSSIDDLSEYFGQIDSLYSSIIEDGYKTQRTLYSQKPRETTRKNLDAPIASMNEIGVSIGRDGTLFRHYRGAHRLTIAKIANIDSVPIQVLVRHRSWQSIRDEIRNSNTPVQCNRYSDHPDLSDIT